MASYICSSGGISVTECTRSNSGAYWTAQAYTGTVHNYCNRKREVSKTMSV